MKLLRIIRLVLRGIFDESAYERFCQSEGLSSGKASYDEFMKQCAERAGKRLRCC